MNALPKTAEIGVSQGPSSSITSYISSSQEFIFGSIALPSKKRFVAHVQESAYISIKPIIYFGLHH